MAYSSKLFLTLLLACTMAFLAMARGPLNSPSTTLATRLQLDAQTNCWGSLFELQSCTTEVILFFLNGETYLGPNCCRAIRIIERECWPALLGSLGYTEQEEDILIGFCDASDEDGTTQTLPPPSPTANGGAKEIMVTKFAP
ncbi:egg cell-secreted protein 1.1 [Fagus crenata]